MLKLPLTFFSEQGAVKICSSYQPLSFNGLQYITLRRSYLHDYSFF